MLKNRHFLKLDDLAQEEISYLLNLSAGLKAAKYAGAEDPRLKGKQIVLIFEKDSTRTRNAFEVAASDQGAHVTYIGASGSHIGSAESIKDTARVLGRLYNGIAFRGLQQSQIEELAQYAGVPVWNGLTNEAHPTQILADLLTMREHLHKPLSQTSFCFLGDIGNNVSDSLMIGAAIMGMDVRLAGPRQTWPQQERVDQALAVAKASGARVTLTEDVDVGIKGCDVLYTDVWVSMGTPFEVWGERIAQMRPYRVTAQLMASTGNPNTKFMHCLPALHDTKTSLGKRLYEQYGLDGLEVTDEVFESRASIVFDQSENRMHTTKALLVATLTG